ncbi:one-helix protein 2 [Forsythia ovata]|uniref:One-helix protein 2 n=1 Tax=Forsythia ovata TaxID=205694 RepID=A0ABD1U4F9_9LAMI
MYVASPSSSFPCIKFHNPLSSSTSSSSSSSPSSCTSSSFRFSATNPTTIFTIRSSQAEGPFRRPVAPLPVKPVPPSTPVSSPVTSPPPPPPTPTPSARVAVADKNVITLEFQRQKAKELQEYFKKKKLEDASQGPFFGFIGKNEIANGRWAMFGFAVGMLTEYATGSDFVDQVKILLSNFGIVDLE